MVLSTDCIRRFDRSLPYMKIFEYITALSSTKRAPT